MTSDNEILNADEPLIELGWLIISSLSPPELQAVTAARDRMLAFLQQQFPQFQWRMPLLRKRKPLRQNHDEAAVLLQEGLKERDTYHWDFAFVITATDLKSYYKPYSLAMPSQALAVAVISLARLIPQTLSDGEKTDVSLLTQRLATVGLHMLGDLNGLKHSPEPEHVMYQLGDESHLDRMKDYGEREKSQLGEELMDIADVRLEEQTQTRPRSYFRFYSTAIWYLRDDIAGAVLQASPWEFPLRLNRLTTAAISTLMILLMTAEVWDLGMHQSMGFMSFFSALILLGTSAFIIKRQKLLLRRSAQHLTEQAVISNSAIVIVVVLGMITTYLLLLGVALLLSGILFPGNLILSWVTSLESDSLTLSDYFAFAQMIAALGIVIGSLGASFEGQSYFQHIAYVDEEL